MNYLGDFYQPPYSLNLGMPTLGTPATGSTGQIGIPNYSLDTRFASTSSLYNPAVVAGISGGVNVLGSIINGYTQLKTSQLNAKSATEVAAINSQMQALAASAGMSMAQLQAEAEKSKRTQNMLLIGGGVLVAGIIGAAAIFKG